MELYYKAIYSMGHILEKIKNFFFAFLYGHTLQGISMGNIFRKLKKKRIVRFCMGIHYKALVWVVFWRKFNFFFPFSEWTYTIRH
jgi:hypothetical protein